MKTFEFTRRGEHYLFVLHEYDGYYLPRELTNFGVVTSAKTQNQLRHEVSALLRYEPDLPLYDIVFSYTPAEEEYRLWVDISNWPGRNSFYAGMLHAHAHHTRNKR